MGNAYLFEVSWEICNKVGGIYTVIKSKAADISASFGHYYAIGPYFPDKSASEFAEEAVPEEFAGVFAELKGLGIICHYGKWLTDVDVNAILIEFSSFAAKKDLIKKELWDNYGIDSLYTSYFDFDEPVIWAYAAGKLIEAFSKSRKCIAHCHEWLAGAALLYLKSRNAKVATVFTTHATVLGRTLTGEGADIYDPKLKYDLEQPEWRMSVLPKHQLELKAAKNADVFTTVSPITALEAGRFLERKADVLLLNGLNTGKFPTFEDASIRHRLYREKIKEFLIYYFFPYYTFDVDNTLIHFLASRYEFRAKGIDVFIKSLGELNRKLKEEKSRKSIVAFFWVPADVKGVNQQLADNRIVFNDIKDSIEDEHDIILHRLITSVFAARSVCDETYLLGPELLSEIRKKMLRFKRSGLPPLSTHDLSNNDSDQTLKAFREAGLLNRKEDKVKVIFYPIYLTGTDNLLDLSYYEALQGSHFGVFPSFYEPWGYTPVEAAALGVASVTTDLSGFGRYITEELKPKSMSGIFVVRRLGRGDEAVVKDMAKLLYDFAKLSVQERIRNKIDAKKLASHTDWKYMIKNYVKAYELAMKKRGM